MTLPPFGGATLRSISHISQLQTIQDDNDEFVPAGEMVRRLMEGNAHLAQLQRAAHEVCEQNRDVASASQLETIIDETERRKWFFFEVYQGMSNTDWQNLRVTQGSLAPHRSFQAALGSPTVWTRLLLVFPWLDGLLNFSTTDKLSVV